MAPSFGRCFELMSTQIHGRQIHGRAVIRPGFAYGGKKSPLAAWFAAVDQKQPIHIVGDGKNRWAACGPAIGMPPPPFRAALLWEPGGGLPVPFSRCGPRRV